MSMMSKEDLFKPRLPEAVVTVEGMGDVRVRGLSRAEVMVMRKATDSEQLDGPRALVIERKMLAAGLVDPVLTEAEAGRWQQASTAGELDAVSSRISQLSGMLDDAPKSGLPGDGGGPDVGVRALPGGEAVDDGGAAADGDG